MRARGEVGRVVTLFPGGRMIRAGNRSPLTLDGTRTFILGSTRPVVIDPGPVDEQHLETLERALADSTPTAILLTHAHSDHCGNAEALAERTGAPILMGRGAPRLPFAAGRVARWLDTGDRVDCEGAPIEVHSTPGHAPEHLVFLYRSGDGVRALFAGDLFLGAGDTTLVSHPHGNVADYLRSLDVVTTLKPSVLYPAHGPALRHPERAVTRYRKHRLERVEQVRQAREAHPSATAQELVDQVYGPVLDSRLRNAAVGSVEAIVSFLTAGMDRR